MTIWAVEMYDERSGRWYVPGRLYLFLNRREARVWLGDDRAAFPGVRFRLTRFDRREER